MARKDNSPKKEVRVQTNDSTNKEANGKIKPVADEEDRLRVSRHHQESRQPTKSNENPNQMQNQLFASRNKAKENPNPMENPDSVIKKKASDRLPQSKHAEIKNQKQHEQSVQPPFHAQNSTGPPYSKTSPFMTFNPMSPLHPNIQTPNVRLAKTETPPMNQSPSIRFPQPNANKADNGEHIPSVVFNNSRLPEPSSYNQRPHIRYQFPQNMEPVRPPPGFDHLQRPPVSCQFPQEHRTGSQKTWNFEGSSFFGPQMTRPQQVDLISERPMFSSSPIAVNSGASPRPPVCPPFNNMRFPGILGSAELLRWGLSTPNPNQPSKPQSAQASNLPYPLDSLSAHSLSATVEKMHLNSLRQPDITSQLNSAQVHSIRDRENMTGNAGQNSSTRYSFPPNGKTGLNDNS